MVECKGRHQQLVLRKNMMTCTLMLYSERELPHQTHIDQLLSPHARRSRSWRIQVSRFHVVDQTAACMAGKLWGKSAKQKCGQNVGSASWTGVERSQVVMVLISAQESLALMWQLQSENFLYNDPWTARTILPGLNTIRSYFCNSVACIEFSF
jgi:hypothetical protein